MRLPASADKKTRPIKNVFHAGMAHEGWLVDF